MGGKMSDKKYNVDEGEIAKFSRIADKWWDKSGEFKTLHDINPLRLDYIDGHADLRGKRVLDVGCGGGILAESMARRGAAFVKGIDMAEQSLETARLHAALNNVADIEYECIRVEDLAEAEPHSFDVVTCMEMMEHVPDPAAIVRACDKLVKPDGMVFFSTINKNPKSYLHLIVAAEYLLKFVPKGTHDWKKFIAPAELARMCRQAGLDVADTKGMTYHVLSQTYALCDSTDVNYMFACRPAF
ncbi:TPA: bifunctional 2-polyprenyl-6-hydroxyphenol methylase/3-demethylubiquinol 3-O-methyltransferase UbiG [Neisseria meningitidis]